jgi:hypothetical protein
MECEETYGKEVMRRIEDFVEHLFTDTEDGDDSSRLCRLRHDNRPLGRDLDDPVSCTLRQSSSGYEEGLAGRTHVGPASVGAKGRVSPVGEVSAGRLGSALNDVACERRGGEEVEVLGQAPSTTDQSVMSGELSTATLTMHGDRDPGRAQSRRIGQ